MRLRITWDTPNADGDLTVDHPSVMTSYGDDTVLTLVAEGLVDNLPEWLARALHVALTERFGGLR